MNVGWKIGKVERRRFVDPDGTPRETMEISAAVLFDGAPVGGLSVTVPTTATQDDIRAAVTEAAARYRDEHAATYEAERALAGLEGTVP